jgi:peptidyl-prolyl cis-trans isomerase D
MALSDSSQNTSEYIRFSTASVSDSLVVKYDGLPELVKSDSLNLTVGNVYGPELIGSNYKTYKVLHIIDEDSIQKASASHILISADTANMSDSLLTAKFITANDVLQKALSGDDFATLARTYSEGPSGEKGGELGEFETGQMVPEFQEAVFGASEEGVVARIVQTQFGFHIIKVDAAAEKADAKYIYGRLEEVVEPSVNTIDSIGEVADNFFTDVYNIEDFRKRIEANDELDLLEANNITAYAETIGNLDNIRSVISWAFTDAEEGDIYTNLINAEGRYGIVAYVGEASAEEVSLNTVRASVERDYIAELKKEYILKKIAETSGSLAEREEQLNELLKDALVIYDKTEGHIFAQNSIARSVNDPSLIGTAFGIGEGNNSAPLKGENGIYIIESVKVTPAEDQDSYDTEVIAIQESLKRANYEVLVNQAVKANIEIEDQRYKL